MSSGSKRIGMVGRSVHLATVTPTTRNLEWAAGFMDGEGCFATYKTSESITASQVNPEPLEKLLLWFGGRVKRHHPKQASRNDYWSWSISGSRARGVMMTLYSLLSEVRQEQIDIAMLKAQKAR